MIFSDCFVEFVLGLIQSADDKNEVVKEAISDALYNIGKREVNLVISTCLNYLVSNLKVSMLTAVTLSHTKIPGLVTLSQSANY